MRLRAFLLTAYLLTSLAAATAQSTDPALRPPAPASPTTAALERYALLPVSEHTGTPDISLPLYTARSGSLTLPISLSYHAGGVRVTDDASWVGLGWSLQAGGVVTRSVRGQADESYHGFLAQPVIRDAHTLDDLRDYPFLEQAAGGLLDFEPDLFSYTTPLGTGQFMLDRDATAYTMPFAPVRIRPRLTGPDSEIEITGENGTQYQFRAWESTTIEQQGADSRPYTSAWYLTRILSADRQDTISLDYRRHTISYSPTLSQQCVVTATLKAEAGSGGLSGPGTSAHRSNVKTKAVKLHRIHFSQGMVELQLDTVSRQDVPTDARLQALIVYQKNRQTRRLEEVKRFTLAHSYFVSTGSPSATMNRRLRLDALTEQAGSLRRPPHRFTYAAQSLPARDSYAQDHWGYYNGREWNADLIPRTTLGTEFGLVPVGTADRAPDSSYVQAGLLHTITYPTGGRTRLVYEANTLAVREPVPLPQVSEQVTTMGQGIRSKTVTHVFTMPHPSVRAVLTLAIANEEPPPTGVPHNIGRAGLYEVVNGSEVLLFEGTGNPSRVVHHPFLQTGHTYKLVVTADHEYMRVDARVEWENTTGPVQYRLRNELTGGVRIRRLYSEPGAGQPATGKAYRYVQAQDGRSSSGVSIGLPLEYVSRKTMRFGKSGATTPGGTGDPAPVQFFDENGTQYTVSSSPIGQLSAYSLPVSYQHVEVVDLDPSGRPTGTTRSTYSVEGDGGSNALPYLPAISNTWQRGKLLLRQHYAADAGQERLVEQQRFVYSLDTRNRATIIGLKVMMKAVTQGNYFTDDPNYRKYLYAYSNSEQPVYWQHLDSTITERYGLTGVKTTSVSSHHYDNARHGQLTRQRTWTGPDTYKEVVSRYPLDFVTPGQEQSQQPAIDALLAADAHTAVVEQQQWRNQSGVASLIGAQFVEYERLQPRRMWALRTDQPVAAAAFRPATIVQGVMQRDVRYELTGEIERRDGRGNALQVRPAHGTASAFLWDIHRQQLAAVTHASYEQVAATSFEDGAPGRWRFNAGHIRTGGYTGTAAYGLQATAPVQADSLPAGEYELSVRAASAPQVRVAQGQVTPWQSTAPSTGPSAWLLYRCRIHLSGASNHLELLPALPGAELLVDEVRLHPVGAQMTSHTYAPLVGVSSQTGPDGRTVFYEYDGLGRLLRVRDEQGRVLSENEYHYARP